MVSGKQCTFKEEYILSSKAHTKTAKSEPTPQASSRTNVLQRQKTALLEPDDTKEVALSGYDKFRDSITPVSYNSNFGHKFGSISVFSPARVPIQTKLKINKPGDIYEQVADRVADQVMRMPDPAVQRKPG